MASGDAGDAGASLCESCPLLLLQHRAVNKDDFAHLFTISKTIPIHKKQENLSLDATYKLIYVHGSLMYTSSSKIYISC